MDVPKLLEKEKALPPLSYDDLLVIMLEFVRQHRADYPSSLISCACYLVSQARRYSFEKNT